MHGGLYGCTSVVQVKALEAKLESQHASLMKEQAKAAISAKQAKAAQQAAEDKANHALAQAVSAQANAKQAQQDKSKAVKTFPLF